MKRLLCATIAAAAILAGCAGQQDYDMGARLYQLRQYDEAASYVEKAVKSDPGNEKYRELLTKIRQDAARNEHQRGLQFYKRRQLDQALIAFEKAKNYDPSFQEAQRWYESVKQRKEIIQAVLTDVPAMIAGGRPDDALARIAEIEQFAATFPEIPDLKARALAASTIAHSRQGALYMSEGRYDEARKEFFIALRWTPNYRPAAEGLAAADAQLEAIRLVQEGNALLAKEQYQDAYARFQQALKVVPGHKGALAAIIDVSNRWARALYDEGRALEEAGGFDGLAEALRRFERAGALTERFADLDQRIADIKARLAPEFLARAQQYEQLGEDYLGLALINYRMSVSCDPSQTAVARRAAEIKASFDRRRAFYIDIRSLDHTSAATSFGRQLAQQLKEAALASGMTDLYVMAPFDETGASTSPAAGGLSGRRLTIFTSLLSENVESKGKNRPEVVRSRYRLGTRFAPNPAYQEGRRVLAAAQSRETEVEQDYQDALARLAAVDPADPEARDSAVSDAEYERRRLYDAQDEVTDARDALAATPEEVEQEIFQPYDYKVFSVTMDALVEVSLEAADPDTGAVRTLEVINGAAVAEDVYTEGVSATDAEGVMSDPEALPTDSELLGQARADAAAKAVAWLRKSLGQMSMRYYEQARDQQEIGNAENAAEYFYAFYLSTPDKNSPEALEAIDYVRNATHLVTPEEVKPVRPGAQ